VAVQERDLPDRDNDFDDANEVVYYHWSTLFSVYALSDASEAVIERYRYDAYGACTVLDADGSADGDGLSDVENPYLLTSRRLDAESGLMQYRLREHSPKLGRFLQRDPIGYLGRLSLYEYGFLQRDPIGYLGRLSLYEYVRGGPVGSVDPLGLWVEEEVMPHHWWLPVGEEWIEVEIVHKYDRGFWGLKYEWIGMEYQRVPEPSALTIDEGVWVWKSREIHGGQTCAGKEDLGNWVEDQWIQRKTRTIWVNGLFGMSHPRMKDLVDTIGKMGPVGKKITLPADIANKLSSVQHAEFEWNIVYETTIVLRHECVCEDGEYRWDVTETESTRIVKYEATHKMRPVSKEKARQNVIDAIKDIVGELH